MGVPYEFPKTTMFPSFFLFVTVLVASVHSFIFVAATPEPLITPAPFHKRDDNIADGSNTDPILSTESFPYSAIPYEVNPWKSVRGPQFGYNMCNSSTQGPESRCQTLIVNSIVRLPFLNSV